MSQPGSSTVLSMVGDPLEGKSTGVLGDHGYFPGTLPQFGLPYIDLEMTIWGVLCIRPPYWAPRNVMHRSKALDYCGSLFSKL
jgi:hypothetical protein